MPRFRIHTQFRHTDRQGEKLFLCQVVQLLQNEGWHTVILRGNHCQLRTTSSPIPLTVAGHPLDILAPGTLLSLIAHHASIQRGETHALCHRH